MKFIFALLCPFLLSSCVYYGVQRDLGGNPSKPCTKGTSKQNTQCKAEIKAINNEIRNKSND